MAKHIRVTWTEEAETADTDRYLVYYREDSVSDALRIGVDAPDAVIKPEGKGQTVTWVGESVAEGTNRFTLARVTATGQIQILTRAHSIIPAGATGVLKIPSNERAPRPINSIFIDTDYDSDGVWDANDPSIAFNTKIVQHTDALGNTFLLLSLIHI